MKRFIASLFMHSLILANGTLLTSCGTDNAFEKLEKKTDKEEAQSALQKGDYQAAINALNTYLAANPNDAQARAMLANAYLKKVGIDELKLAAQVSQAGSDNWKSIVLAMPAGSSENVKDLQAAVAALAAIPAPARTAEQAYQLAFAQASLAVTLAKKTAGDGASISDAKVSAMSNEDANAIYDTLKGSKATVNASATLDDNAGAQKLAGLSDKIADEEGDTDAEKLKAFLAKNN